MGWTRRGVQNKAQKRSQNIPFLPSPIHPGGNSPHRFIEPRSDHRLHSSSPRITTVDSGTDFLLHFAYFKLLDSPRNEDHLPVPGMRQKAFVISRVKTIDFASSERLLARGHRTQGRHEVDSYTLKIRLGIGVSGFIDTGLVSPPQIHDLWIIR